MFRLEHDNREQKQKYDGEEKTATQAIRRGRPSGQALPDSILGQHLLLAVALCGTERGICLPRRRHHRPYPVRLLPAGHRHSHQLPGRGGGVDALPARKGQRHSGRPCHPAPSRPDDCPFIHLQGKPVRETEVPLRADGRRRKGEVQNGLPGVPRRDSRGRVCRVQAVLPLRRSVPAAGIGRREENGKCNTHQTEYP